MVHLPDGDTDFFDIVTGNLLGDTIAPYILMMFLDYVLRSSINLIKENGFTLRIQEAENMIDADYAYDLALLANTPTQAESLLYNL